MRLLLFILMLMLVVDLSAQPKSRPALGSLRADSVVAMPKKSPIHVWASGGVGGGWGRPNLNALDLYVSANVSYRGIFSAAVRSAGQIQSEYTRKPDIYQQDYAVMLGLRTPPSLPVYAAAYAGISQVYTLRRGALVRTEYGWWYSPDVNYYESRFATAAGIPYEMQVVLKPWRNAGVGLTWFGDQNPISSFSGLCIVCLLGRLD